MEELTVLLKLIGISGYIILAIYWWVTWIGMHNNTIDDNSFRLILPFISFDKRQFTESGNKWRVKHLYANAGIVIWSLAYWLYSFT
jgi:hypothetical protein